MHPFDASRLATSPALWPPMPSATTNRPRATRTLSSFCGRSDPGGWPIPTAAQPSPHHHASASLRLQHGVADLDAVARGGAARSPPSLLPLWNEPFVDPRSSTIGWPSSSKIRAWMLRHEGVVLDHDRAAGVAPDRDLARRARTRAAARLGFERPPAGRPVPAAAPRPPALATRPVRRTAPRRRSAKWGRRPARG